jgi:hypothetical protein
MKPMPRLQQIRRTIVTVVLTAFALAWSCSATAPCQEKDKADRIEKVTLQYRTSRDAFAPSKFIAVNGNSSSAPLEVSWDLPKPEDKEKREVLDKANKDFDALIKKLEQKGINGAEFEAKGEWLDRGFRLKLTTVPELTEAGKKWIKENER